MYLLVATQIVKNSAASLTWYLQQKECHLSLTTLDDSGYETQTTVPANVKANLDHFEDKDMQNNFAQTLEKELSQAANGPLDDLEKVNKTVKPVYDGFWHDRDQDIINRLDLAARKLKEKRAAPASRQLGG